MNSNLPLDGIAHIPGGGLYDNVPRILPEDVSVIFRPGTLPVPPIFKLLTREGNVGKEEAYRVFNMGVGMCVIVAPEDVEKTLEILKANGEDAYVIGEVVKSEDKVIL